jgi:hypothetical protein
LTYGDFPLIPLIWVITLQNRRHPFCIFLHFRDLLELKQSEPFSGVIIFPRATKCDEEAHEGAHEVQMIPGGVGLGHTSQVYFAVVALISSVFVPDWLSWPKKSYIKTPEVFPWGGGRTTRNHEIEAIPTKIGGGNTARAIPGRFSNVSNITNTATMMRRE